MTRRFLTASGVLLVLLTLFAPAAFAASKMDNTPELFDGSFGTRELTFTTADFGGNAGQLIDLANFTVSINFAKAAGENFDPPYPTDDAPFYNEILFQLITPTGTTVNLINFNSFNEGAPGTNFDGTLIFSSSAADLVNVNPNQLQAGTFRPVDGDFSAIAGETAIGTYILVIADSAGDDALRYRSFLLNIGAAQQTELPEPVSLALCASLIPLTGMVLAQRRHATR